MLMIPTPKPAGRFVDLSDGPRFLASTVWGCRRSPEILRQRAAAWMQEIARPILDTTPAYQAIAWAHEMPRLKEILDPVVWLALGELLSSLPADVDSQTLEHQPLIHQLLAGELALTLATRLPQSPFSGRLERSGRAAISLGLSQISGSA